MSCTWNIGETLFEYLKMTDLVNIPVELFNEVGIEIEREFSFDVIVENELKDCLREFEP